MANKKKQHFVPKFYLRNYSSNKKSIDVYVVKSNNLIRYASIRNQAYKGYFYDKDAKVENGLKILENKVSEHISQIINKRNIMDTSLNNYLEILFFIVVQTARTEYSADSLNEMTDKLIKTFIKGDLRVQNVDLSKVNLSFANSAAYAIKVACDNYKYIFDLKCKILVNNTNRPFITSDNPVVKYNQFLEPRKN